MSMDNAMPAAATTWAEWLAKHELGDLLTLPDALKVRPWAPTEADRDAAWELYTEVRTRIVTQPLHYRAGTEAAALDSLVDLFRMTRPLVCKYKKDCAHFAILTVFVLNQVLRRFTARWHRRVVDGKLESGDDRHIFRQELHKLQRRMRLFLTLLGRLAEGDAFTPGTESGLTPEPTDPWADRPVPFGIVPLGTPAAQLQGKEDASIRQRRRDLELPNPEQLDDVAGLAISGGGIRSATFALGVVQGFAQRGLVREFDYLSTVSGGGYLGAFLSSYLNDSDMDVGLKAEQLPFRQTEYVEPAPLRHLRNRSKSLIEPGLISKLGLLAQVLFGIAMSLAAVLPLVVLVALLVYYLNRAVWPPAVDFLALPRLFLLGLLGVWGLSLLLPVFQRLARGHGPDEVMSRLHRGVDRLCFFAFVAVLLLGVMALLLAGYRRFDWFVRAYSLTAALGSAVGLALLLTAAAFLLTGLGRIATRVLLLAAGLAWPLVLVVGAFAIAYVADDLGVQRPWLGEIGLWGLWLATIVYAFLVLDVNLLAPHYFYRNQLAKTYLIRHDAKAPDGVAPVDLQKLSKLQTSAKAPYHLINAAINVPSSARADLRGRNTDFFLFSKHYCGSVVTGYFATEKFEELDPHLDLGTAMAISGAAVSPQMGTATMRHVSFLLGLINARLGYWLPNPKTGPRPPAPSAWYLLREMFGAMHEGMAFWNVSDGGHVDNLGVFELLRRKCKFIVCIDGEADPTMTFASFIQVTRYAAIDLGVAIDIDLDELRLQPKRFSLAHFTLGRIRYSAQEQGLLLYVKSSLTGNELPYVLDYRARHAAFPHDPTAQQLFDEAQFEAYRALGLHVAEELFRPDLVETRDVSDLRKWFKALAEALSP
jgi:hypothetical protein